MKLAIVGPSYPFRGGIAHHTTLLYRHLRERHEVRFLAFKRQYPMWLYPAETDLDPSQKPLEEPGVERILDSLNPLTWLRVAWRIRRFSPDAVIVPWWVAFWAPQFFTIAVLVKVFSGIRVVFICHNVVEHESSGLRHFLAGLVLRRGDLFVVHSEEDRANLVRLVPGARVSVMVLPSFGQLAGEPVGRDEARARLGLESKERVILFFGFVRPYKGLRHLVEAMPEIRAKTNARLLIAGEFWHDRQEYFDRIRELGLDESVTVMDRYLPNEEIGALFAAADLVVQPYETATQSAVTQIAFDLNRPVVVTDVGGLPESVHHLETGYVVPPKDPKAIADSVIDFFENARGPSMEAAVARDRERFAWPTFIDTLEHELQRAQRHKGTKTQS